MMLKVYLLLQIVNLITRYSCDFESQTACDAWTLNPSVQGLVCPNQWYIGEAGASEGVNGLFISYNGQDAKYTATTVGAVEAYVPLEMQKDQYILSFDWNLRGYQPDTSGIFLDRLYVCWVPLKDEKGDSVLINSNKSTLPAWVEKYALQSDQTTKNYLAGARSWSTATCTIDSAKQFTGTGPYRLVFVWTNNNKVAVNPPAMVDNIEIQPYHLCPAPTHLQFTLKDEEVRLSWQGTADAYEYRCYSHETKWTYSDIVSDTAVTLTNLPEGRVDFYVRALCGEEHSHTISTSGLIYYPGTRCINFLDINEQNCYVADSQYPTTEVPISYHHAIVDYGPESEYSRHTVHYDRTETDPMTQGMLYTVPKEELASVRLGNKRSGSESERVEYNLHINAKENPVLVLKYAIVMENPDEHNSYEQPRFKLRILKNGVSVGNHCAEADFTADHIDETKDTTWHRWTPEGPAASDIVWKNWTTVGVDLSEYDGDDLVVQLTSYDCSLTGHFGYAYFTLSCSDGKFKDMSCGEINPIFYAPAGFNYRWYQKSQPDSILSRIDTLKVGYNDTLTYACDMIYPQDSTCYFTLYADAMARFPIPEMRYDVKHHQTSQGACSNTVTFYDRSHVLIHNHISNKDIHDYSQYPTDSYWTFDDSTKIHNQSKYTKEYPVEGGIFSLKISAWYNSCDSDSVFTFTLPDVRITRDTIQRQICVADTPFVYPSWEDPNHITQSHSGYCPPYTHTNRFGCDSIVVINLDVVDQFNTNIDTIIPQGDTITWLGKRLYAPDTYIDTIPSSYMCDSTITLRLATVAMNTSDVICAGEVGYQPHYAISSPWVEYKGLLPQTFSEHWLDVPGIYDLSALFAGRTASLQLPLQLQVLYPDGVVVQRWNDVLAVRNSTYNGGYQFTAFQWMKNGKMIDGANAATLYIPEGLDTHAYYTVQLTRDDGVVLSTCPYQPSYVETNNIPRVVEPNQSIYMKGHGRVLFYSAVGQCVLQENYNDSYIVAPSKTGFYLMQQIDGQQDGRTHNIIVK